MPSKIERAWVAGLMDGDGCVSMTTKGPSAFRKPYVVVDSTDREILDELVRLYGGSIVAKRRRQETHRQCFSWRVYGSDNVLAFLADIVEFMHCPTKRQRATMLIEGYKAVSRRNGHYTAEEREIRAKFEEDFLDIGFGRGSSVRRPSAYRSSGQ